MSNLLAPQKLNDKGQCCGRKPLVYKREGILFCPRCDAAFDPATGRQIDNWAYREVGTEGFFVRARKSAEE